VDTKKKSKMRVAATAKKSKAALMYNITTSQITVGKDTYELVRLPYKGTGEAHCLIMDALCAKGYEKVTQGGHHVLKANESASSLLKKINLAIVKN
jgi:hypothetical protein